jgi:replicative DNA helicase
MSTETVPPELPIRLIDSESERLVLGNILSHGAEFWRAVAPEIDTSHFSVERHRRVFELIRAVADSGQEPGLVGCYGQLIELGNRRRISASRC